MSLVASALEAMNPGTCIRCGKVLEIGMWPFCPHPSADGVNINRDEIPGGITVENYGPNPMTFYSHSERRRYMAAHGLVEKEKWCPMPGTDKDPQGIPNPKGYMDPQTLENARALVSRQGERPFDAVRDGVLANLSSRVVDSKEEVNRATGTLDA